jgi:hypothetical protein
MMEEQENYAVAKAEPVTPMALLSTAVSNGADLDKLERLMALQERWEANEAKKAYVQAMADFKRNPPTIVKDKEASFGGNKGYKYANLAQVASVIGKALSEHGLSASWQTEQTNGTIRVTCRITHVNGYSESCSLEASPDTSGSKNAIQAIGSAKSYLEKYTLLSLAGLAADDQDDDGNSTGTTETLSDEAAANLDSLATEVKADMPKFLKYFKIKEIGELPASRYAEAVKLLEAKRK